MILALDEVLPRDPLVLQTLAALDQLVDTVAERKASAMGKISVAMKKSNRSLVGMTIGLLWQMGLWGAGGSWVPLGAASDRETKFRKGIDPRDPPEGYYESKSPPLVLGGLASVLDKVSRKRRK